MCEYCDFDREPKLKHIELYKSSDSYLLDIERPLGYIPEPWRNKKLKANYCPVCGRKLSEVSQ